MTGHIRELQEIANSIDRYHKGATIANVTGSSANAVGGILSLAGIIAAPFTAGASLVLTAVGAGIGGAGAATNLTAGISEYVTQSKKQKRVDEIIKQYKSDMKEMSKRLKDIGSDLQFLSQCSEGDMAECDYGEEKQRVSKAREVFNNCRKTYWPGVKAGLQTGSICMKTVNTTASVLAKQVLKKTPGLKVLAKRLTALSHNVRNTKYAKETGNVKQLLRGTPLALSKTTRAVSGAVSVFFVAFDIYSITKDSIELSKGSKTEVAKKIRDEAQRIEDALKVYEDIYQSLKKMFERN
uniref:apolipoprotein L3-like n=1 Tax=Pristiophorus japonicus TaxID=55135 RepID=UPI00398E35DB